MRTSARALLPSRPRARANVQSTSSRSTPRSRPRAKRSSDEEEDETRERTESNDFFDATGRLEDVALIVGDVCALWTLTLCETVSAVSAKPSFPGWLAPVEISARDGAAFAARAMWALGCWVVASAVISNAYEVDDFATPSANKACREVAKAWMAWAPLQAIERVIAISGNLEEPNESIGVLASTLTALGVLVSWRCYAKVFSLLEPSANASNRERDDVEWGEFFRVLGGVAALSVATSGAEMVYYSDQMSDLFLS